MPPPHGWVPGQRTAFCLTTAFNKGVQRKDRATDHRMVPKPSRSNFCNCVSYTPCSAHWPHMRVMSTSIYNKNQKNVLYIYICRRLSVSIVIFGDLRDTLLVAFGWLIESAKDPLPPNQHLKKRPRLRPPHFIFTEDYVNLMHLISVLSFRNVRDRKSKNGNRGQNRQNCNPSDTYKLGPELPPMINVVNPSNHMHSPPNRLQAKSKSLTVCISIHGDLRSISLHPLYFLHTRRFPRPSHSTRPSLPKPVAAR